MKVLVEIMILLNFSLLIFFKQNFVLMLLTMELILVKLFLFIMSSCNMKFIYLFIFLVLAACGSVIGLSILVKMFRKQNKIFVNKSFY